MVLGPNGVVYIDGEDDGVSWSRPNSDEMDPEAKQDDISMPMSFKSMLDSAPGGSTWYFNPQPPAPPEPPHDLSAGLHPPEFHGLAAFYDTTPCHPQFLGFDLPPDPSLHFLQPFNPGAAAAPPDLSQTLLGYYDGFDGPSGINPAAPPLFFNRPKVLRPLEVMPQTGAQPTLFQKRAAKLGVSGSPDFGGFDNKRKRVEEDMADMIGDDMVSGFNYDSDDGTDQIMSGNLAIGGIDSNGNNETSAGNNSPATTGAGQKGKKKGMPAKNLMAERRRRKKLNDRLYMLRSVVPKISKMDRASILGDAIDYLKELLQKINDLHNELESTPAGTLPPTTSFHPLTPTPPTLPCRVKEELGPASMPSPKGQTARVEVRVREGRAVNIHMFCARRPGLLLSTMRALDNLGLDIQQAVISCFNGFALDVFRAEQCRESQDILPEHIKAVLLESAGFQNMI